ncbi:hypothetical protein GQR58_005412 [Nymphon striatum]|nr:hypothetical protein GQR58_005412 [Nymphon striatum]
MAAALLSKIVVFKMSLKILNELEKNSNNQELLFDICTMDWEFFFFLHPMKTLQFNISYSFFCLTFVRQNYFVTTKIYSESLNVSLMLSSCSCSCSWHWLEKNSISHSNFVEFPTVHPLTASSSICGAAKLKVITLNLNYQVKPNSNFSSYSNTKQPRTMFNCISTFNMGKDRTLKSELTFDNDKMMFPTT